MTLNNHKGAALVEMAIILPLLLLIVCGIFEYGRAMFITNALNNAAREGARRVAVTPSPINNSDVKAYVTSCIPVDTTGIIIDPIPSVIASGASVTVTVTLPFKALTGIVPVPDSLRGQATMRYEL